MSARRVVITGLGAISSLGVGAEHNFEQALAGRSGIGLLQLAGERQRPGTPAAQIRSPLPELVKTSELPIFDRFSLLGWAAASEALAQSGLDASVAPERSGVFWGSGMGGALTVESGYVDLFVDGKTRVRPMSVVAGMTNAAAAQIALRCGFKGSVNNYSSACVSSAQAIGEAYRHIRHGYADRVLAGGSEALLGYGVVSAWDALRVLAPLDAEHPERSCRPFSAGRGGLVLGEAGAAVMLESLESAQARGATILAELLAYGASNDATHITKPDADGQERAMRQALEQSGLPPSAIGYINAHGAGTPAGDVAEATSIKQAFGAAARELLVSSTKSMHGHTLGAAGALEFVLTTQAVRHGAVPPTAFLDQPDPECDLDFVPRECRRGLTLQAAMSNSFAFGGSNVALIVGAFR
ncbi:beta-ketoacyl-[acyl-carrier-protein] synthase family protein [Duganella violaceipulchra]|uniref:Nodulation protein E n=1 Tax=Duganella violaceipulchra TaxID=2849652 RepID=A0AA41HAU0_9BURK|nr:beta-ketoacyl-[acyl-carrier-protein] synthase family protein [Duganella violaceicalia]MBV6322685.1 beta-ketoacyl-[acyl-carrier-protein] synthase family protein [Duganella violaceicalia]MCP2010899.1 3-oxoacyl-[acyl-carrier-protein] synthase II [Duganella violaceicalia]